MSKKILGLIIIGLLSLNIVGCGIKKEVSETEQGINYNSYIPKAGESLENKIILPKDINMDNNYEIVDLEGRNNAIAKNYLEGLKVVKAFSSENSIDLKNTKFINDVLTESSENEEIKKLLSRLDNVEAMQYFSENEGINVDLSINIQPARLKEYSSVGAFTFADVTYKASIENIDKNFKFKGSKLDDFRGKILKSRSEAYVDNLDYDTIDKYVSGYFHGKYDKYIIFFNRLDENSYERIKIDNNNIYYKFIYDPKF